jgi:hypothetical protein
VHELYDGQRALRERYSDRDESMADRDTLWASLPEPL